MKLISRSIILAAVVLSAMTAASAQNPSVESLRSQLRDLEAKEGELQTRAKQLDEDLKPENIEKYFALNGSTRPEELREQRRRQLERERDGVRSQLEQLTSSRARLETSIAAAEAAAYRQSALPPASYAPSSPAVSESGTVVSKPKPPQRRARQKRRVRRRS